MPEMIKKIGRLTTIQKAEDKRDKMVAELIERGYQKQERIQVESC